MLSALLLNDGGNLLKQSAKYYKMGIALIVKLLTFNWSLPV